MPWTCVRVRAVASPLEDMAREWVSQWMNPINLDDDEDGSFTRSLDALLARVQREERERIRTQHRGRTVIGRAADGIECDWRECEVCNVESPCPTLRRLDEEE